jgi:hypothetical protein
MESNLLVMPLLKQQAISMQLPAATGTAGSAEAQKDHKCSTTTLSALTATRADFIYTLCIITGHAQLGQPHARHCQPSSQMTFSKTWHVLQVALKQAWQTKAC